MRINTPKKTAALFFAKKEDAEKAIADFNDTYVTRHLQTPIPLPLEPHTDCE
jgi:hypothetical protein